MRSSVREKRTNIQYSPIRLKVLATSGECKSVKSYIELKRALRRTRLRVPEPDCLVARGRCDQLAVR